ncbi:lipid A biosynthesis acyltransferase [Leadbetterella byssophila DSM 17132]|uniref:Lipid A biosynthesis acyltransferase n=1 Tax=Leadbetterella byssophila (strain DSM 17132 / JCM 16389 / KACC 11308 / NBRC 106382 / 4M15) TaxID=649349 RepID=E4RWY5_LEAB4|nr:lipid A biosynthesis acyltransferase [Leadbetterella byssophila]ADQ17191.1 lipid A biosynthesis acyltransferase [Leadbetterella byssophila DSM 17132]
MNTWDGKSKGTVLGYKIFVSIIRKAGVKPAYLLLFFVASYYFLFLDNQSIYYYFRKRLGYSAWKARAAVFKSYFTFGQTIIDKVAISAGLRDQFTYEFDGVELLKETLAAKKGAVLISAHMGNFEIAEYFFSEIDLDFQINLVTIDQEDTAIKAYLESIKKPSVKLILIKEDMSHIFEINEALSKNEVVCFTGDRYVQGSKFLEDELLGETARFPAGPFMIASRLGVPVIYVYVMKEDNLHYHLYAREAKVKHRDAKGLLRSYTDHLQQMIEKYPLQWFNYFDFWSKD